MNLTSLSARQPNYDKYQFVKIATAVRVKDLTGKMQDLRPGVLVGVKDSNDGDDVVILPAFGIMFKVTRRSGDKIFDNAKNFRGTPPAWGSGDRSGVTNRTPAKTLDYDRRTAARLEKYGLPTDKALTKSQILSFVKTYKPADVSAMSAIIASLVKAGNKVSADQEDSYRKILFPEPLPVKQQGAKNIKVIVGTPTPKTVKKPRVRLQDVDMPEEEDFNDTSIPSEFSRHKDWDSFSSGVKNGDKTKD